MIELDPKQVDIVRIRSKAFLERTLDTSVVDLTAIAFGVGTAYKLMKLMGVEKSQDFYLGYSREEFEDKFEEALNHYESYINMDQFSKDIGVAQ